MGGVSLSKISRENVLNACSYDDIHMNTKILNNSVIGSTLIIHLPFESNSHELEIFDIVEISGHSTESIDISGHVNRTCGRPWIDIDTCILNLMIGQHIYRCSFINIHNHNIENIYFSYIVQDDNPEKPYVYMS